MKSTTRKMLVLLVLTISPVVLMAKGDPEAGQTKTAVCEACHGKTGESVDPTYPNLAGQYASYLRRALMDYREGKRTNAIMAGFAQNLTDQDIADLAAWYSSQEGLEDISIK